jgi:polysaccharide biosynthesis transport protein
MELADYVAALRKHWAVLVVATLAGGLAGLGYAQTVQPQYRSTTSVFVSLERSDTVADLMQGANFTQNLVTSYASLATMPAVLAPVITELGLDTTPRQLSERIDAVVPLDTAIIEISARADGPWQASEIADSVARHLSQTVSEVSPKNQNGRSTVRLSARHAASAFPSRSSCVARCAR